MKLVHSGYMLEVNFAEDAIETLIVESPEALVTLLGDMWAQTNGDEGKWILSEEEAMLNISKKAECIFNPFEADCNERKILTSIYKHLESVAKEEMYEETQLMNRAVVEYIDAITMFENCHLTFSLEPDIQTLLKGYNVRIDTCAVTLAEKLLEYITIQSRINGYSVFITVNLKQYVGKSEIEELYKNLLYEKVYLLDIESAQQNRYKYEHTTVIDKELCIFSY